MIQIYKLPNIYIFSKSLPTKTEQYCPKEVSDAEAEQTGVALEDWQP